MSREFESLSMELLEHCQKTNDDLSQILLTYHLSSWSDQTCLSLAVSALHRPFLAQTCCQALLSEMWMGGLRTRRYATLKVSISLAPRAVYVAIVVQYTALCGVSK